MTFSVPCTMMERFISMRLEFLHLQCCELRSQSGAISNDVAIEWGERILPGWQRGGARPHSTRVFAFEIVPHSSITVVSMVRPEVYGNACHCPFGVIFSILNILQCSQSGGHASVSHGLNFTSLTTNTIFLCLLGLCISSSVMCLPIVLPSILLSDFHLVLEVIYIC